MTPRDNSLGISSHLQSAYRNAELIIFINTLGITEKRVYLCGMKINKYPDGSSYVEASRLDNSDFTFKVNNYEDLWHLNQVVDVYNNLGVIPNITIPNLIDAQADRRFKPTQSSGLKQVCKFLNGMDARFRVFHPHNPEVVEALMDNVAIISNFGFVRNALDEIYPHPSGDRGLRVPNPDVILMSADAGGFKPLMKLCEQFNWKGETYSASKARLTGHSGARIKQFIDRQDFGGKDILIVDDICIYGGTFKGLSTMLRERNVGKLYLAVSHMTVQDLGEDPVTNYFDKVFTTNSKYDSYTCGKDGIDFVDNLEIIKMFNYDR